MSGSKPSPAKTDFIIGIDLGTTHTVVSYLDLKHGSLQDEPKLFPIEQLVGPGEVAAKPLLPSFRYHPLADEIAAADCVLPWGDKKLPGEIPHVIIGEWARELGSKAEGRLVNSAKSWLCHAGVDRGEPILPWAGAEDVTKVSPVLASASYLFHIRCAWDHQFPESPLQQQEIIITVPASFDEMARSLTLEAAKWAGYPRVLLLEEPQAVCYDWFHRTGSQASELLKQSNLLLVCDVGGGTTDLSLIDIKIANESTGELKLNRVGVGDHLLLGGDNVDLALARIAEQRIVAQGKQLSATALAQLVQQSRKAKELLLSEDPPHSAKVTVLGSGSRLIGGAKSADLSLEEVLKIALDGFLPVSEFSQLPNKSRSAVVEFGLPYTPDPAISHHLAEFLHNHQTVAKEALGFESDAIAVPDTLLLNGGVFNSNKVSDRIVQLLSHWAGQPPQMLTNGHPDLAVAFGAVAYGKAKRGASVKIGGGSARSFFLNVESTGETKAICLLQKGSEEEIEHRLEGRKFALRVGAPVQFHLYSSSSDQRYDLGEVIAVDENFIALPPLVTALPADAGADQEEVLVELVAKLTEVGTVQLECVSLADTTQRWLVEFELRKSIAAQNKLAGGEDLTTAPLPPRFPQATDALLEVFGTSNKKVDAKAVKNCRAQIEKLLGKREEWHPHLLRELTGILLEHKKRRRRSENHEKLWANLMGFCLRPGYGYPLDDWRVQQVWNLYNSGLQFDKTNQGWAEWWTLWRRIAGGLEAAAQEKIYKDIAKYVNPASARNSKVASELKKRGYEDMVRLVGCLENLPVEKKIETGNWLLKRLEKSSETATCWWSLGRLGARELLYGSAHTVVPVETAEQWLQRILAADWKKQEAAMLAAVLVAKKCGDRVRDINDDLRSELLSQLKAAKASQNWIDMVAEVVTIEASDEKKIYGDSLPPGIRLVDH